MFSQLVPKSFAPVKKNRKRLSHRPTPRLPIFESLEPRHLLAVTASVNASHVLNVVGDANANDILIEYDVSQEVIKVREKNGPLSTQFFADEVASVNVQAAAGDDRVDLDGGFVVDSIYYNLAATLTVSVDGGDGDDVVIGSTFNDVLIGGNHDDFLVGMAGNDTLTGGAGNDALTGGSGRDSFDDSAFQQPEDVIGAQNSPPQLLVPAESLDSRLGESIVLRAEATDIDGDVVTLDYRLFGIAAKFRWILI